MSKKYNILVVDDDPNILDSFHIIIDGIDDAKIFTAMDSEQVQNIVDKYPIDLAFIDIVLPDTDGYQVCKYVKEKNSAYCIIMSSDKKHTIDKLKSYRAGAQQFIEKPFELIEIEFMIINKLSYFKSVENEKHFEKEELNNSEEKECIDIGDFNLNLKNRKLMFLGKNLKISENEFILLKYFLENPEEYLSVNDISKALWDNDYASSTENARQLIFRFKQKIESESKSQRYIASSRLSGYKFFPCGDAEDS